jgi:hypothetical protein
LKNACPRKKKRKNRVEVVQQGNRMTTVWCDEVFLDPREGGQKGLFPSKKSCFSYFAEGKG